MVTQREGETLIVGDDVRIHFKRIKGNSVRLAIEAPRHVLVQRVGANGEEGPAGPDVTRTDDR